jgi:hypothetical protein
MFSTKRLAATAISSFLLASLVACTAQTELAGDASGDEIVTGLEGRARAYTGTWANPSAEKNGEFASLRLLVSSGVAGEYTATIVSSKNIGRGGSPLRGADVVESGTFVVSGVRGNESLRLRPNGSDKSRVYAIGFTATIQPVGRAKAIQLILSSSVQILSEVRAPINCLAMPSCGDDIEILPGQACGAGQICREESVCGNTITCAQARPINCMAVPTCGGDTQVPQGQACGAKNICREVSMCGVTITCSRVAFGPPQPQQCGAVTCGGERPVCCNSLAGICTKPGEFCIQ